MKKEPITTIEQAAKALLENLKIVGQIEVVEDKENQVYNLQIQTNDSGFLIGYHGETLEAFQLILSLIVYKKLGSWARLMINVGDYREKREEQLKRLALNIAQKVKFTAEAQVIPSLSSAERRIIHLALVNDPDVVSESEGEGEERKLIIKPRHQ
jgi:spoIIIJ-associated protein